MRRILSVVLLIAGVALLAWQWRDQETLDHHAQRLQRRHGIVIGFGDPVNFWTAPFKAEDAVVPGVEMQAADTDSIAVALRGIETSLNQYPPGFVAGLIHAIFICGELRMGGARAGGTAGPAWIVLAAPSDIGADGIRLTSSIGVHHELSSFVLRRNPATLAEWTAFAPAGANFVAEAGAALAREGTPAPDPASGFLSAYGATNPENDFNVYAEKIFTEPAAVARLAKQYPLIRRKLAFVCAAYMALDPRFADIFRKLGLAAG